MDKLKTLKDIQIFEQEKGDKRIKDLIEKQFKDKTQAWNVSALTYNKAIRQEAIKWIDHLKTLKLADKGEKKECIVTRYAQNSQINWIKNFFNITEEELK